MARKRYPPEDRGSANSGQDSEYSMPEEIPFAEVIQALLDENSPLQPRFVYRLSDLGREDLTVLEQTWKQVPAWRRQALMEDIEILGDNNYLLSFEEVSRLALTDSDPHVRELAVRSLWNCESTDLVPIFIQMMDSDTTLDVRAAAAGALGQFIYLGEIEEIPVAVLAKVEERLLMAANGNDLSLVRRRSLEALGFSGHPDVAGLIEKAYSSGNNDWIASALYAMGRSANERWIPQVIEMLDHDYPAVRMEAARAAGELEAAQATSQLLQLLMDEDEDVRAAAIWSLSQIGGEGVRQALEKMYEETEDDEEAELIESALDNLDFTEEIGFFATMMDVTEGDIEDEEEMEYDDALNELFGLEEEDGDEDVEDAEDGEEDQA